MGIERIWESCVHTSEVVHVSSCPASLSTGSISSFWMECFHKIKMCHGDPNWATDPNWSQNIKLESEMWHEFLFAVLSSLPSAPAQPWPLIRRSICNNHRIFNTFVLIPSTPYSKAFSLPKNEKKEKDKRLITISLSRDHTLLYWAFGVCIPSATWQEKTFKMCFIIWGRGLLLSWTNLMQVWIYV